MAKVTVVKERNYTTIDNGIFKDTRISFKAKGLLTTMLSLPPTWNYTIEGLATLAKDGRDSIKTALKELESFGYLERKQVRNENGSFCDLEYFVFEKPKTKEPLAENPSTDKSSAENNRQLNTNISSTDILSTDEVNTDKSNTDSINASQEDKSSLEVNIYASVSEETASVEKKNRYIPQNYSYEQLREHIRPVYDIVLKNRYGYDDNNTPLEKMIDITIGFCKMYEVREGIRHKVLSDMAYINIVDNFMNPPVVMDYPSFVFDFDCYMAMAETYFDTEYNKRGKYSGIISKSLSHFMSCIVRENLFNRTCL